MNKLASRPFQYFNKFKPQKIKNLKQGTERLAHRSLLEVKGPDSTTLLQGLITNDMTNLSQSSNGCIYAMFLNNKGRIMYDTIIYKIPGKDNRYLIEVDKSVAVTLCKHLIIHKLRKEVSVKNVDDNYQLWVSFDLSSVPSFGASPIEVINEEMEYDLPDVIKNYKFNDPRIPELGTRVITCVHKSCTFVNGYLAVAYRNLRYRLGVPEGTDELPVGNCFPLEANCDYLNGVSFNKGCYLGQELTARSHHTGVIRKRYMPLYIKERLPNIVANVNDIVEVNNKTIGKIRGFDMQTGLGIGLLRIEDVLSNKVVSVGSLKLITLTPYWWPNKNQEKKFEQKLEQKDSNKTQEQKKITSQKPNSVTTSQESKKIKEEEKMFPEGKNEIHVNINDVTSEIKEIKVDLDDKKEIQPNLAVSDKKD